MKNCLILGSGRSGTSMVAGSLANTGYFMGKHLLPALKSNPKGFYEDREVNAINENLIAQILPKQSFFLGRRPFHDRLRKNQLWLSRIPVDTQIPCTTRISRQIERLVNQEPYCFKDPRFSYTLPCWRPFLKNTGFVCVFRDPASTAVSIVKECRTRPYLRNVSFSFDRALEVWTLMYSHILQTNCKEGGWIFLHYNQFLMEEGPKRLERFTGATVDRSFPDPSLRRSNSKAPVPDETMRLYNQLCDLSGYHENNIGSL